MGLKMPDYGNGARPATKTLLTSVLAFDQFDDWLPDPVYYEDQRRNEGAGAAERIDGFWRAKDLPAPLSETLSLPRDGGKRLAALALPLDARVSAQTVIAALAPRVVCAMRWDMVYGFEFKPGEQRPCYSQPGMGLDEAYVNALTSALKESDENPSSRTRDPLFVLDVVNFNGSLRAGRLAGVLQKAGARPEEMDFLWQLIGAGEVGLPSVDDAFAFVYNFYLQPVDEALFKAGLKFFRYRDEYFLLTARARQLAEQQLRALQLESRLAAEHDVEKFKEDVERRAYDENDGDAVETVHSLDAGDLTINYACSDWDPETKECNSDNAEVRFDFDGAKHSPYEVLFEFKPGPAPLDAVRILPMLRAFHRRRSTGVLLQPPFDRAGAELAAHRQALAKGRRWLSDALRAALQSGADWQITWVAPLLSDLGPLTAAEAALLRQAVAVAGVGAAAKAQARLALARSATDFKEGDWAAPGAGASSFRIRAALLGARYLFRRGVTGPWESAAPGASGDAAELKTYLADNIKGASR